MSYVKIVATKSRFGKGMILSVPVSLYRALTGYVKELDIEELQLFRIILEQ